MAEQVISKREILSLIARVAALSAFSYLTMKWLVDALDPTRKQQLQAKERAKKLLKSLGVSPDIKLNNHELMVASNLVEPSSIQVSWKDIAGLESVIEELRETVILPIKERDLFASSQLTQAPRGVLLHGPPGCGKTMIAKATAKEAGARFINLDVSQITDKWYGESQKLASAVFTLATKLSPCIIFIDEIDSLLRIRDAHDHEATAMVKAQFMQMWDGLETNNKATVVVMGATNRPKDVDKAILRRMPATFHVGLPDIHQRTAILKRILEMEAVELRDISNEDMLKAVAKLKESKVHCGTVAQFAMTDLD
jgi:SpoVK/Ycf46/Vps4 family AAA+-type ATPase